VPFAPGSVRLHGIALEAAVELEASVARIHLALRNEGEAPVALESVGLGFRWTPPDSKALRYLRHGWQSWSLTESRALDGPGEPPFPAGDWLRGLHHAVGAPPGDRADWHESDLLTVVGGADGSGACLLGAYERGIGFAVVYARTRGEEVELELEQRLERTLEPGASLRLDAVRVELGASAGALLEAYGLDYGRRSGARVTHPFVSGWCSWYYAFADVTEDDVRRNLDALVGLRDEVPVEVVQLDDGYQRAVGDWRETNAKFPRGLARLAQEIRDAGFTAGLWTAPFCVVRESALFDAHPEWLRSDGHGPFRAMVHGDWSADSAVFALDPSRPDVAAHLEALYRELYDWGFHYHKLDFLFVAATRATGFEPVSRAARLRRGLEAIRAGVGEEAFLLGCGCPLGAAVGVVDGMRIGPDVAPHWEPDPARAIPGIEETLPSTRGAIRSTLLRSWMHRRLWVNDPDCLMVRRRNTALGEGEREALATTIAATGGTVIVSDDVSSLDSEERALWQATTRWAHDVDRGGVPGRSRVRELLAPGTPVCIEADLEEQRVEARVNAGDRTQKVDLPAQSRAVIGSAASSDLPPHTGVLRVLEPDVALAVFCDFDGTFSVQDVGSTLAQQYGSERRPAQWARYERGEITPWEYNLEVLEGLDVPLEALEEFLRTVVLDPGAKDLVQWCRVAGTPFRILSDGFDWNLNRLQTIHDVRFAYSANRLHYDRGRWRIGAGHPNAACGCGTGTCKRGIIESYRARCPETVTVHIGNGRVSDTCGAMAAHHAFAKDSLAPELERRGVAYAPFETLHDVIAGLEALRAGATASG
jgi:alpha-galactosidase